jgi:AraC family transcriptional regulator
MRNFTDDQVTLIDVPATPVAVMTHCGDPALIGETIRRFIAWRKQAGLRPPRSATFNILHNDPLTTPAEDYRLDLCAGTTGPVRSDDPAVSEGVIPAGRCAVLRLTGSSDDLRSAISFLYADWLPRGGEAPRDFPIYVQRVSFFPDVPEAEAITDIFLPLM